MQAGGARIGAVGVVLAIAVAVTPTPQVAAQEAGDPPPPVTVLGGTGALPSAVTDQLGACATGGVRRISGSDRMATAAALAREGHPDGAGEVIVASGEGFADALAAGPLAAALEAPLLLAAADRVPPVTMEALRALRPQRITLVGGEGVLGPEVARTLAGLAPVRRLAGRDRFATAAALAAHAEPGATVWVATGADWADALAAGAAAAQERAPVLLVTRDVVPETTARVLDALRPARILVAGGTGVVGDGVIDALRRGGAEVRRLAGPDRFATAAAIADHAFPAAGGVLLATAGSPFDALAAVPIAAAAQAPLLLGMGPSLPAPTVAVLDRFGALRCRRVVLEAGPAERVALGSGVVLRVTGPTGEVVLGRGAAGLLLPGSATLRLAYPTPLGGVAPVTWTQDVPSDAVQVELSQPWRGERPRAPGGIVLGWHAGGSWDRYRQELVAAPGLTVSAPVSLQLDATGALTGSVDAGFVAAARARGVAVWVTVASLDADHIRRGVGDPARRTALARAVSEHARRAGAQGVNIDLEGFTHDTAAAMTDFARQLTAQVHAWGGVTSIDLVSMTDTWATPPTERYGHWSTAPQRRDLSAAVDYVALMTYDEHNRLRPNGPVASPRWVEQAVRYQLRYTDPDRLLLGVNLYGRVWDRAALDRPRTVPIRDLPSLIARGQRIRDPAFGIDRVELGGGRFTWAEDHAALAHRTALVRELGLAGTASWRLGFDDAAVWRVLGVR